jgi:hypothetical protein
MVQTKSLLNWNQQFDVATGVYDKIQSFRLFDNIVKSVRSSYSEERAENLFKNSQTPNEKKLSVTSSIAQKCWPLKISKNQ